MLQGVLMPPERTIAEARLEVREGRPAAYSVGPELAPRPLRQTESHWAHKHFHSRAPNCCNSATHNTYSLRENSERFQ
jgi:hypothetical protein